MILVVISKSYTLLHFQVWFEIYKFLQSSHLLNILPSNIATLRNKRKLASVTKKTQEEHPRNGQSRNTSVPRFNGEYKTQFTEEIEGSVAKKLSQEFNRTESRILGTLFKLGDFLFNSQVRTVSKTVPGTSRNTGVKNLETNGDCCQNGLHLDVGSSVYRSHHSVDSDPNEAPYNCHAHMVFPCPGGYAERYLEERGTGRRFRTPV